MELMGYSLFSVQKTQPVLFVAWLIKHLPILLKISVNLEDGMFRPTLVYPPYAMNRERWREVMSISISKRTKCKKTDGTIRK